MQTGEAEVAAQLSEPLREAGYEVVDYDSILVGESLVEKASEHLAAGWPVVICGTVEALGAVAALYGHRDLQVPVELIR